MEKTEKNGLFVTRKWSAKWINGGIQNVNWMHEPMPAPYFRKTFDYSSGRVTMYACGIGYQLIYINGRKVGIAELNPPQARYDVRVPYTEMDVTDYLHPGKNVIACVLGCGLYDCHSTEVWHFDKAPWRNSPRMILELRQGRSLLVATDTSWKTTNDGPIRFDGLRNGENYDARMEMPGWNEVDFDDSKWNNTVIMPGPGGILTRQLAPPCAVRQIFAVIGKTSENVYDFGQNMAGRALIKVQGEAGATVKLRYSDMLNEDGTLSTKRIEGFIMQGDFQTERYTLKGGEPETWHSSFTYHGFQYVEVTIEGRAELLDIFGQAICSDFGINSKMSVDDESIQKLLHATEWSFRNNFVGIPTDCPHREKCGWTGDASLVSDTGLFLFDLRDCYAEWLQTVSDCQRPNGQLSGIAPTGGWGFNWGSGPAWDCVLFFIPWKVYVYTGDFSLCRQFYKNMERYLDYLSTMEENGIVKFGLGEWHDWIPEHAPSDGLVLTAFYAECLRIFAMISSKFGLEEQARKALRRRQQIAVAYHAEYYKGNGQYDNDSLTAMTIPLAFDLCPANCRAAVLRRLVEKVRRLNHIADFGIFGAKFLPRVLAENGLMEDAMLMYTQTECPGWMNWIKRGATTLWDDWKDAPSRDHIMFGDFVAWFMQYLAGFTPNEEMPGAVNRNITLRIAPFPIHFTAEYCGTIVDYTRSEKAIDLVLFCDQRVQFHSGKGASRLLPIGENRLHFDIQ